MPATSLKGYSVQTQGSNSGTWGVGASTALNEGCFNVMDVNLAGVLTNSLSSSNITLSTANTQNCMLRFTGTLTGNIVVSPDVGVLFNGFYYWENLTTGSFSVTVTTGAGSLVLPQSRRGVLFVDSTNGPRLVAVVGSSNAQVFPAGTVSSFYQNAAPTGWTIVSSLNDYGLRIVSSAGGVTSGSVAYSTLFGRTATDGYTLLVADVPPLTYNTAVYPGNNGAAGTDNGVRPQVWWGGTTPAQTNGGGGSHVHGIDMRVKTADLILATFN